MPTICVEQTAPRPLISVFVSKEVKLDARFEDGRERRKVRWLEGSNVTSSLTWKPGCVCSHVPPDDARENHHLCQISKTLKYPPDITTKERRSVSQVTLENSCTTANDQETRETYLKEPSQKLAQTCDQNQPRSDKGDSILATRLS